MSGAVMKNRAVLPLMSSALSTVASPSMVRSSALSEPIKISSDQRMSMKVGGVEKGLPLVGEVEMTESVLG